MPSVPVGESLVCLKLLMALLVGLVTLVADFSAEVHSAPVISLRNGCPGMIGYIFALSCMFAMRQHIGRILVTSGLALFASFVIVAYDFLVPSFFPL